MALWTPYADNIALDLSKPVKEDIREYPPPAAVYHFGYRYTAVPQLSPLSSANVCSYERLSQGRVTPTRVSTLSPPMSPASTKRPYCTIEDSLSDDPDFQAYERDALRAMAERNGGSLVGDNPRMRRSVRSNNERGDDSYRRQRERNNFAAKQSRDRRKLREIHLALKVSYLKRELAGLKALLAARVCARCRQACTC